LIIAKIKDKDVKGVEEAMREHLQDLMDFSKKL